MTVRQTDVFPSVRDIVSTFFFFFKCVSEEVGSREKDLTSRRVRCFCFQSLGLVASVRGNALLKNCASFAPSCEMGTWPFAGRIPCGHPWSRCLLRSFVRGFSSAAVMKVEISPSSFRATAVCDGMQSPWRSLQLGCQPARPRVAPGAEPCTTSLPEPCAK